ncbi:COG4705 family protein [Flavobacterium rhizosphaerae]|uniref:Membrane-anchored protein n=1 Tax=Flavobacterium rhizosphaerae TaxID=3163298 RepID=A0ABW8YWI3_9FLAO
MKELNKVAQITLLFWVMKIIATTLGETLGDFFSMTLNYGYTLTLIVTAIIFLVTLALQLNVKKYIPAVYWLVIVATTTLGTEISDFIDRSLHLGYIGGSALLLFCLLITLFLWYKKFDDLQVYPIANRNKEAYYWVAILFSNSLGTALGDFLSDVVGLSYLQGAMVTAMVIIVMALLHYFSKVNQAVLFWLAFIFTRPFGATFGDFLTKPAASGGLDLGTLNASLVSVLLMVIFIIISHFKGRSKSIG